MGYPERMWAMCDKCCFHVVGKPNEMKYRPDRPCRTYLEARWMGLYSTHKEGWPTNTLTEECVKEQCHSERIQPLPRPQED